MNSFGPMLVAILVAQPLTPSEAQPVPVVPVEGDASTASAPEVQRPESQPAAPEAATPEPVGSEVSEAAKAPAEDAVPVEPSSDELDAAELGVVHGTVVDYRRGRPLERVTVHLECAFLVQPLQAETNARGRFQFPGVRGGQCTVRAYGESNDVHEPILVVGGLTQEVDLELDPRERGGTGVGTRRDDVMVKTGVAAIVASGVLAFGAIFSVALVPCGQDGTAGADCAQDPRTGIGLGFGLAAAATLGTGVALVSVGRKRRAAFTAGIDLPAARMGDFGARLGLRF